MKKGELEELLEIGKADMYAQIRTLERDIGRQRYRAVGKTCRLLEKIAQDQLNIYEELHVLNGGVVGSI